MGALDPIRMTDKLDDALLDVLVARFEVTGNSWFCRKVLWEYFDAMEIDSTQTVLDSGRGTGVAARTIAGREGLSGRVTGIDLGCRRRVGSLVRVPLRAHERARLFPMAASTPW